MTPRLPALSSRQVLTALRRAGWHEHHTVGSHCQLRHPGRAEGRVTVPMHARDVKRGTLMSILRQAHLTIEEFLELL
ncbi:MAG: type II toxin-antitoxin system HicA family toxin [Candidatus Sumerlaeia bacterium]|nr:type II toxin-antitoxin system HicA family toxin [Candidatus Sumerlaeia bacterium]